MKTTQPALRLVFIIGVMTCLSGCGGPERVAAPQFDASGAAAEAMSLYDTNSDGELDETELESCMALARAIDEIDTDGNGLLSEEEIRARVDYFIQGRVGRQSLMCRIVKGNRPVEGATVTFVPEPFMADVIESASGKTNFNGEAVINIADQMGGVQTGFYKVQISKLSASGKETLNKKYNEETIIGQEVTSGSRQLAEGLVFQIK